MQGAHRWVFLLVFSLLSSSSEGFADWYDPLLCADLEDCLRSPGCLFFCFGDFLHLAFGIFPPRFWGAHRKRRSPWGLGLRIQTLIFWVLSVTTLRGRTLPTLGSRLLVGIVLRRKAETSQGNRLSCRCGRWSRISWCRGDFKYPFWGTSYGAGAPWEGKWEMNSFINNTKCVFVSVPLSRDFCSNTCRYSPTTRFRIIPNFWGPVEKSWPLVIL